MRPTAAHILVCTLLLSAVAPVSNAADTTVYPAAILPFAERGSGARDYGAKVSDILFAMLAADPNLMLVDREDLSKTLQEQELSLSGMVAPDAAVQVGRLVGAKLIITGSVVEADKSLYLVAKIIGTETSRVLGQTVKGGTNDDIAKLAEALATKVGDAVRNQANELVAQTVTPQARIAALNQALGKAKRPSVSVKIAERHIGQATIDPAAETEVTLYCKETGFEVVDPSAGSGKTVDVIIEGEAFSEFAVRRGNLASVKARVEVKALDRASGKLLATDRQTAVEVDLSEQIAGKKALQNAAATIAERLLPKLAGQP